MKLRLCGQDHIPDDYVEAIYKVACIVDHVLLEVVREVTNKAASKPAAVLIRLTCLDTSDYQASNILNELLDTFF